MMTDMNAQPVPDAARRWWPALVAAAVLAAIVLAVFLPVVSFQFTHYDDDKQILGNPYIRSLRPGNVWWIFTHFCIASYYPVRLLSFAVDHHFWGLDPTGYHLTNVLLHAANVLLVFWLLLRICAAGLPTRRADGQPPQEEHGGSGDPPRSALGDPPRSARGDPPRSGIWQVIAAAVATAIFAIHPVVVEPVAWIPGREELLMTLFALLCLHFHRSAHLAMERGAGRLRIILFHALAAGACAAAAMSNVVGAAVPLIVVAYDVAVARPKGRRAVIAAAAAVLPLWAIAIAAIVIKDYADRTLPAASGVDAAVAVPWLLRPAFGLDIFRLNLTTLVWPRDLTPRYMRLADPAYLSVGTAVGLACALAMLALLWLLRRERTALLGILWFLLALAPTSQIISHHILRADRFLYLPLAGLVLAAGAGLAHLTALSRETRGVAALSLAAVAALAAVTLRQVPLWKDGLTIFGHAAIVTPDNADAHRALGTALWQADRNDEATPEFREAIRLDPASAAARLGLGHALMTKGNVPEAIRSFEEALRLGPDDAEIRNNLGVAWLAAGNLGEAMRQWREALRLEPDNAIAWNNLGAAAYRKGDMAEAIRCFGEAIRLSPARADSHQQLGLALARQGDLPGALRAFEDAIRLRPEDPEAYWGYAMAMARLGRLDEAEKSLRKAIEVDPRFGEAYDRLGLMLVRRGNFAAAAAQFEQAIRSSPSDHRPMKHLARLLATCPEGPVRSGARAVALAEQAWRMTGSRDPDCLDTLAAAYAEAGRFDEAVAAAQKVVAAAEETHRPELIEIARKRLALYQSRMPLREGPPR
jgi:tetratricopeptide (TPR) repeat protein